MQRLQKADVSDYIIIPKGTKGASALELLVPDPESGFHVLSETRNNMYLQDLSKHSDDKAGSKPFGKVEYMALNAKKDLLVLYCDAETRGRIIVMKSNYTREFNR